jgi:Pentapeptide repeats (8 copies)
MDENHQDKTESKLTPTEDKSTPASLPLPDQRGTDQLQKNHMEETIEQFRDRRYQVTEEYSNSGQRSKVSGEHPQRKTLWDWLQLLVIPLLLVCLGIGFTWGQHQTSLQIAKDAQEEATLKAYLDDMTTLLLDRQPRSQYVADKLVGADAVVARAKTLTALRRLTDPRLKAIVVQFLYGARLIGYYSCDDTCPVAPAVIDLSGADLSGADLSGADLSWFRQESGEDYCADLSGADLSDTDISGADLSGANLKGAKVTDEQLAQAKSLEGAIMPDGSKHP